MSGAHNIEKLIDLRNEYDKINLGKKEAIKKNKIFNGEEYEKNQFKGSIKGHKEFEKYLKKNPFVTRETCSDNIFDLFGAVIREALVDFKLWNDDKVRNEARLKKADERYNRYLKVKPSIRRRKSKNNDLENERSLVRRNLAVLQITHNNFSTAETFLFSKDGLERIITEFRIDFNLKLLRKVALNTAYHARFNPYDEDATEDELARKIVYKRGKMRNYWQRNKKRMNDLDDPNFLVEKYNIK